jgi:RHS repeat-associated protein
MAKLNPFRFSTKYDDDETDFLYYGCRYYNPSTGRWPSRDPLNEPGFLQLANNHSDDKTALDNNANLYRFIGNDPTSQMDPFGLWGTDVHHRIVEDWLTDPKYKNYPCGCCTIDVISLIEHGSDDVDGVGVWGFPTFGWGDAQSSKYAYRHAMRSPTETVAQAQKEYDSFVQQQLVYARLWAQKKDCFSIKQALRSLGKAYHSISDSYSPAHTGFQIWWDSKNGPPQYGGFFGWLFGFVLVHEDSEDMSVYNRVGRQVPKQVAAQLQSDLDSILSQCGSK